MKTSVKAWLVLAGTVVCGWPAAGAVLLDSIALIETGPLSASQCRADFKRGSAGEVSRYQIKPAVWRQYSAERRYTDPATARRIACRVLNHRIRDFTTQYGKPPTPFEVYVLWNAPAYLTGEQKGRRCSPMVSRRAERFANLVAAQSHWPRLASVRFTDALAVAQPD